MQSTLACWRFFFGRGRKALELGELILCQDGKW